MGEQSRLDKDVALRVYDAAIAEYRFNVQLSWDRSKFFLTLLSALIAAGVGLIKVGFDSKVAALFLIFYFLMISYMTYYALESLSVGKRYVRESNYKKTLIERELGLLKPLEPGLSRSNLSIAVTQGQQKAFSLLVSGSVSDDISAFSLTDKLRLIFIGMMSVSIAGALASALILGTDLAAD